MHRQAVLYAEEYGWNSDYEALIAGIVAEIHANFDPARERYWIAERGGEVVGSVFLVEPSCRGLGLGRRLVRECVAFARQAGYRRIELRTMSILAAARRIYETEGFTLADTEADQQFGHDLVSETWELNLGD